MVCDKRQYRDEWIVYWGTVELGSDACKKNGEEDELFSNVRKRTGVC